MKVKVAYTWKQALSSSFNQDRIRREAQPFRTKRLTGVISKHSEPDILEIRNWLVANEITGYKLLGVFTVHPDKVYYDGLAIDFKTDEDMILFKMRFS